MSTASVQTPLRAPLRARVWTWVVSIVLTLSALGCAFGGGMAVCHGLGGAYLPGQEAQPFKFLGSSVLLAPHPTMTAFFIGWLVAWALHLYASRRRRMSLLHVLIPAGVFLLGLLIVLRAAPVCTSL